MRQLVNRVISHNMGNGTPRLSSLGRALEMLDAVLMDAGRSTVSALARSAGMPVATAHRHVTSLAAEGLLTAIGQGRHVAGPRLLAMGGGIDLGAVLAGVAAGILPGYARQLGCVVQLGTLDGDMVTYRVKAGGGAGTLFTRVGMQLEAYCSAIGKVLLANLPEAELAHYLAAGPFVALTANTITDAGALARELGAVRADGFAFDREEIAEGLACIAVPVRAGDGRVVAAISASRAVLPGACGERAQELAQELALLQDARQAIEGKAFGRANASPGLPHSPVKES